MLLMGDSSACFYTAAARLAEGMTTTLHAEHGLLLKVQLHYEDSSTDWTPAGSMTA